MRSLSKTLTAVAAAGMAIAPIAAHAGTRAESAPVSIDTQRASAAVAGESNVAELSPLFLIFIAAIIAALTLALTGKSRG